MNVIPLTQELGLVLVVILMLTTPVETRPGPGINQTMVTKTLKRWATSWCNEYTNATSKILFDFIANDQCPLQC